MSRYIFYVGVICVAVAVIAPWTPAAFAVEPVHWPNLHRLLEVPLFETELHPLLVGLLLGLAALAALAIVIPTGWMRRGPGLWLTFDDRRANRLGSWRPC